MTSKINRNSNNLMKNKDWRQVKWSKNISSYKNSIEDLYILMKYGKLNDNI